MSLIDIPRCAQNPFGVIRYGNPPWTLPQVLQAQMYDFLWRIGCGKQAQVLIQAMALALKR